jgi:enoyl-CoA hydratase/carnithine racemase
MLVERTDEGRVARLVLNLPEKLNPLSSAMIAALSERLAEVAADPGAKVVVLAAKGRAFSAGHDLREMSAARAGADRGAAELRALFDRCAALMLAIRDLPQPVIAEVQGLAAAAGCQLVAACDLAVAAEHATFGVNGVNLGLFCSTPMVALSRNVPRKRAFEMLTTGAFLTAPEAVEAGLINRAVPAGELTARTMELAGTIAGKLGAAVRIGKRAFYRQLELPLDEAYAFTGEAMVRNMAEDGTAEGISAFLEKRHSAWVD